MLVLVGLSICAVMFALRMAFREYWTLYKLTIPSSESNNNIMCAECKVCCALERWRKWTNQCGVKCTKHSLPRTLLSMSDRCQTEKCHRFCIQRISSGRKHLAVVGFFKKNIFILIKFRNPHFTTLSLLPTLTPPNSKYGHSVWKWKFNIYMTKLWSLFFLRTSEKEQIMQTEKINQKTKTDVRSKDVFYY